MAYKIQFTPKAAKQFSKLDKSVKHRINDYLIRLEKIDTPRLLGKYLQGGLTGTWSYRVGHYRLLSVIKDNELIVTVVHLAHRGVVYK